MDLQGIKLYYNVSMKDYTFTKTGGAAQVLALPKSNSEVVSLVEYCARNGLDWIIVGHGSNLIIKEGGIPGVVISLKEMNNIIVDGKDIVVDAGVKLIDVSAKALENNLTGLEFACGIPGSVGGAVYMNAGAYGGEIKDILKSAEVLVPNGTIQTFSNKDFNFSYRHSSLEKLHSIVLQVTFQLKTGNYETIRSEMNKLTELRKSKQPLEYPSCGSVFKRPNGYFAGKLIQDAGLQGMRIGGAEVSQKHAGFIVNIDRATATDYVELIEYVRMSVREKFGVVLENEVRIIGKDV